MSKKHLWIEIVTLSTLTACALALLIAAFGVAAGAAVGAAAPPQTTPQTPSGTRPTPPARSYEGMLTCSRCGARHSADLGKTAAECARVCVRSGAAFALVNGDQIYVLDGDLSVLKKFAGRRARIMGSPNGKTINVTSVAGI